MAARVEICNMIHSIEVRFVVFHPFHKVRENDGAPGTIYTSCKYHTNTLSRNSHSFFWYDSGSNHDGNICG